MSLDLARTIATDGTFAYAGFLVLLVARNLLPARRRSRRLRKRIGAYGRES